MKKILDKIARKTIGSTMKIGDFSLKLGRNHNLPAVLERYPDYGGNLLRLASVVNNKYKNLKILDIGANVGDTAVSLLNDNNQYHVFAVEGDKKYLEILYENIKNSKTAISIYENFLGSENKIINTTVTRKEGTLKIDPVTNNNSSIKIVTLDSLVADHSELSAVKLLKIDTDGYDNQILRGSCEYLLKAKPVIFFEYDSFLLKENGEEGFTIFDFLEKIGYKTVALFDNYGRFFLSVDISNKSILFQLDRYMCTRKGAFPYFDIAVFHENDDDIASVFVKNEEGRS